MKQIEDSLLFPHLAEPRPTVWRGEVGFAVGVVPSVGGVLSIGGAVMEGGPTVGAQGAVPRAQGPPLQRDHGVLAG